MLESVAVLRVATRFLTQWYSFYRIRSKFLHSQPGSNTSKETTITVSPINTMFENILREYKKISSDSIAYATNILSFFKKSGEHSHPQEYGKDEVTVMKDLMRKRARETNDNN